MPTSSGGSSSGGSGAWTLISTTTLSGAGTFDLTGIAGTFNDLQFVLIGRSSTSGESVLIRFNGDTAGATTYYWQQLKGTASTASAVEILGFNCFQALNFGSGATTGFSACEFTVFGYASTSWVKSVRYDVSAAVGTGTGNLNNFHTTGFWNNTAAITQITITTQNTSFAIGSTLRLYGRT
jgi:hypothetical protein